jgi:hypothetical protein
MAVRIVIAAGRYELSGPLVLSSEDGGTADAPVRCEAAAGSRPVISGGRRITGFKPDDFPAIAAVLPNELPRVTMIVLHKWDMTRRFIDRLLPDEHSIVTAGQGMKPYSQWAPDGTVFFDNARAFLDQPGEWFLDPGGTLLYRPLPREEIATADVVAPVADTLLVIKGDIAGNSASDPAARKVVAHVTFDGLSFQHSQWLMPPGGFEPVQAAAPIEAAVMVEYAQNVVLLDCEIAHVGTYGAWLRRGCSVCRLERCHLFDLGGGVRIGDMSEPKT